MHSVKPVNLVAGLLTALAQRSDLDTHQVDDIVLGCVTPVGDQGADIAKTAALVADWAISVAGVQVNRFCASGLEAVNLGAMKVRSGFEDLVVVGGVESMSRVPMGSDGGAWVLDPQTNLHSHFTPQGIGADLIATLEGFSRQDVDSFALQSQQKAARASADGSFSKSLIAVQDQNGIVLLDHDEFIRGDSTPSKAWVSLKPSFEMMGQMGFDATRAAGLQPRGAHQPCTHPGQQLRHRRRRRTDVDRLLKRRVANWGLQPRARIVATAVTSTDPTIMLTGPAPATRKAWPRPVCAWKTSICSRSTRPLPQWCSNSSRTWASTPHASTSTAVPSRWATPLGATGCAILWHLA